MPSVPQKKRYPPYFHQTALVLPSRLCSAAFNVVAAPSFPVAPSDASFLPHCRCVKGKGRHFFSVCRHDIPPSSSGFPVSPLFRQPEREGFLAQRAHRPVVVFCLAINSFGCPRRKIKDGLPVFALCAASGVFLPRPPARKEEKPPALSSVRLIRYSSPHAPVHTPARKKAACTLCTLLHPFPPRPFRSAALRPSAASGRPSSLPSAPHTLIFSITWHFFPLKEFSFLETIRFLCNYVSVVVFYLNFFRRHAMKSLLCFFLGLAFLPVPASAIEHLPPPLTPFK